LKKKEPAMGRHPDQHYGRTALALFTSALLASAAGVASTGLADEAHDDHAAVQVDGEALGTVDFGVSCAEASQPAFDRALGLMHHMMYEQARAAFEEIAEADPECAMAYWGIATTRFQPLWPTRPSVEELEQGLSEIEQAKELEAGTERERNLIAATEGFFREPETAGWWTRLERWSEGMAAAHEASPDDHDVAALYALSLLALSPAAEERAPLHDEAEAVLRAIYEQVPTHPGAIHYSIHATDVDGRAENALDMVKSYADIAPEVPHALHMPTHIYVRLGEWPGVIEWNRRSADVALERPVGDAVSHHYPHATDYILYAYLQQGDDDRARAVLDETLAHDNFQRSFISAFHLAAMPARYAVERRQWEEAAALEARTPDYLPWDNALWAEGMTWLARGLGALHTGDLNRAGEAEARLETLRDDAKAAGEEAFATYIEIDRLILAGWIAREQDRADEAVELIREAARLEGTVEKHPVTPGALLPPYEALGDLLLDLDRPEEALEAYEASNEVWPGRFNTLLGAARAATAAGDEDAARVWYAELIEVAGSSERAEVSEAKEHLEG
jgi:tetratricopeptide (TPR) repeat protein